MDPDAIRAMARLIYGTDKPRGVEMRSWLHDGKMSESQRARLGRADQPPCFATEEQWVAWCIHEACRPVANSGYCYDCTRRYQLSMADNNRCEHPLTTFIKVGNPPDLVGRRHGVVGRRRAPPR